MARNGFADFGLRVDGLDENPKTFSFAELRAMPKQEQITEHFCIQCWASIAKWAVFRCATYSMSLSPPQTLAWWLSTLWPTVPRGAATTTFTRWRTAPLLNDSRLRNEWKTGQRASWSTAAIARENELGFKQVKWIEAIEFVHDFDGLGGGRGGYNEDHEAS